MATAEMFRFGPPTGDCGGTKMRPIYRMSSHPRGLHLILQKPFACRSAARCMLWKREAAATLRTNKQLLKHGGARSFTLFYTTGRHLPAGLGTDRHRRGISDLAGV